MPKATNVIVSTVDAELEFTIGSTTTGKQFFDRITKAIGLRETWYFGIRYFDSTGLLCWLDLGKKILKQDMKKENPLKFNFVAKYFPEDASEELILYYTKNLFFLQVKNSILTDEYYCPAETAVLLASYAVQIKYGDYDAETHKPGFLEKDQLLPPRVIKQHSLAKAEWDERVMVWYKEHKEMSKETAITEYLKIAQDLEMYGINYFEIRNKKNTKLWLGVDALGINIYDYEDKLTPKIGFPWSEVNRVSKSGKKFVVNPTDKNSPDFVFTTSQAKINKQIIGLCTGNYELYSRRRKNDSVEVTQMKNQVKEEKLAKEAERQRLEKERRHREEEEKKRKQLEEKIQVYVEQAEISKLEIERSQKAAEDLEKKLWELELNRKELIESQMRAEEARRLAEEAVHAERTEREMKEMEAAEAQYQLEQKQQEALVREEEARRLQEELRHARILVEDAQNSAAEVNRASEQLRQSSGSSSPHSSIKVVSGSPEAYVQKSSYSPDNDYEQVNDFTRSENGNNRHGILRSEYYVSDNVEFESRDLQGDYDLVIKDEEERITQAEKDEITNKRLTSLRTDLELSKVEKELTKNDLIYVKNVKQGRDKYKTLKQIRQGNTKIRVEIFESL